MKVGKYSIDTSNHDKILYPDEEISKKDIINYYLKISELMLPHLRGRPLTMKRFPDGIGSKGFYQKKRSDYFPDWIKSSGISRKEGENIEMLTAEKKASLVYLANQACLVLHPWLSRTSKPEYPDKMIFDLDPSGGSFKDVKTCAKRIKEFLENEFDLNVYVMSTGQKGLHVAVPVQKNLKFDKVKNFAGKVAHFMAEKYPDEYTVEIRKNKRGDRIFLDYLRNEYAQTAVSPYSLRAIKGAPVAAPLDWSELDNFDDPAQININNIFERMGQKKDPWNDFFKKSRSLKTPLKKMSGLIQD
jgi:bifunctional non-homologous end joining protein LigD